MDRFRAMTVFVAAAQAGSLSGAARRLSMPLTTVSRHLAWLETHVGTTLISRTTRHMALTDAGSTYLEVCRRVLDDLDGAESALAGRGRELAGDFTMTAPIEFGRLHVLPIVQRFLTMNPRVNCQLILSDRNVDLAKDGVDIAIRIGALADFVAHCIQGRHLAAADLCGGELSQKTRHTGRAGGARYTRLHRLFEYRRRYTVAIP